MSSIGDMTAGSPTRSILRFSLPMIAGYIMQQTYTVADAVIVGQWIGVGALAAVGASWAVMFLIMGFCNGACAGFAIPVAQAFGAKDFVLMRRYAAGALRLTAVIALLFTVVTTLLCTPILRAVNTPADIFADARVFLLFQLCSIPCIMAYNILASLLRALGNSRHPFYFLVGASLLNILLSAAMVGILHMGVAGVGLATMLSQAAAAVACAAYIRRHTPLLLPHGDEWQPRHDMTLHLLGNGVPMGLQFSITGIGIVMLQTANNALGTVCVAAFTASMRVKYLFTCVFENIGAAMATYCGQNIGARRLHRIALGLRSALGLSLAYFLFAFVLIEAEADTMMLMFVDSSETEIIGQAAMLMRIACCFYPALGVLTVLRYSIQGLGFSRLAVMSGVMEMVARTGVSLWMVPAMGFTGVCLGDPVAWLAADLFLIPAIILLYRRLRRQMSGAGLIEQPKTVCQ